MASDIGIPCINVPLWKNYYSPRGFDDLAIVPSAAQLQTIQPKISRANDLTGPAWDAESYTFNVPFRIIGSTRAVNVALCGINNATPTWQTQAPQQKASNIWSVAITIRLSAGAHFHQAAPGGSFRVTLTVEDKRNNQDTRVFDVPVRHYNAS